MILGSRGNLDRLGEVRVSSSCVGAGAVDVESLGPS